MALRTSHRDPASDAPRAGPAAGPLASRIC
jgi:hypothetical protein